MTTKNENDLKSEIQHIFDSGANEIRIFEMTKSFIKKRYKELDAPNTENQCEKCKFKDECRFKPENTFNTCKYYIEHCL